jgi:hypothetical protein
VKVCPLCRGVLIPFQDGILFGHHNVTYQQCSGCRSILLPDPDWLDEAYSSPISALDVGLLERCQQLANVTTALLTAQRLGKGRFLDFAGGYGTLTRLMRDRGFDFRHVDPYCSNIFAGGHEGTLSERYDLVTAFEVLEHLADPVGELAPVAAAADLLLVTTQVLPQPAPAINDWPYYACETGQHVTFYTVAGLRALAERLDMRVATSGRLVHLFHRGPLLARTRLMLRDERLAYFCGTVSSELRRRRRALTSADAQAATRRLADGPAGD